MSDVFIGIDLGGTSFKIGCFDPELNLIAKGAMSTDLDAEPAAVLDSMFETTRKMLADNGFSIDDVRGVGIGAPGPSNIAEGIVITAPNLPKFRNVPMKKVLGEKFNRPVVFENDANVACWGEHAIGAGKGVNEMVFFTLGTGIGGGVIAYGKIVHGFADGAAELGHMIIYPDGRICACGQKGCVEAYASADSTVRRAVEAIEAGGKSSLAALLKEKGKISCKDIYKHLAAGDALAKEITDGTAKALALLCISILHVTEPQRIVFGGGMIAAGDLLLDRIRDYFDEYIWTLRPEPVEICFATLGADAGIIGAAALAENA